MTAPKPLRLVFMGTPDFAAPTLEALAAAGHDVACVYTQPPRPAGRGRTMRPSAVHQCAARLGLPVLTPVNFKDSADRAAFAAHQADVAVVAAYGLLLPAGMLAAPRLGCVNAHASLLPRWRGAAPIQRAIMAGDSATGVTIMQMAAGLDTGDILATEATPITPDTTGGELHDALAAIAARLTVATLEKLAAVAARATPQPAAGVTYAHKITARDRWLDWRESAESLARQVMALSPRPGAWLTNSDGARVRVLRAKAGTGSANMAGASPGTVTLGREGQPGIACGDGILWLEVLQPAGGRPMNAADFQRGHALGPELPPPPDGET